MQFVQLARIAQGVLRAFVNFFIQMLDSICDVFHFDKRLGLGVLDPRFRQLSDFFELLGFRGDRLNLSFELFFLGLFEVLGCHDGSHTKTSRVTLIPISPFHNAFR